MKDKILKYFKPLLETGEFSLSEIIEDFYDTEFSSYIIDALSDNPYYRDKFYEIFDNLNISMTNKAKLKQEFNRKSVENILKNWTYSVNKNFIENILLKDEYLNDVLDIEDKIKIENMKISNFYDGYDFSKMNGENIALFNINLVDDLIERGLVSADRKQILMYQFFDKTVKEIEIISGNKESTKNKKNAIEQACELLGLEFFNQIDFDYVCKNGRQFNMYYIVVTKNFQNKFKNNEWELENVSDNLLNAYDKISKSKSSEEIYPFIKDYLRTKSDGFKI